MRRAILPVLSATLPFTAIHAIPAAADEAALEEIIVSATRRETSLQDTALAVAVFTGDLMEQLNISNPANYEALVPSLSYQGFPNRISLRGIGRFSNVLGTSPGVGIYNDGIYSAEAASMFSRAANTQRTEVLRGPQGTLYGRNTTGGAVNIVSKRPTEELSGDLRFKYGEDNLRESTVLLAGPLSDSVRAKFFGIDTYRDGIQENIAGKDLRSTNGLYLEGQVEWDITENLKIWSEYVDYRLDYRPGTSVQEDPYDCINMWSGLGPAIAPLECAAGVFEDPSRSDPWTVARNTPGEVELIANTLTVHVDYTTDHAAVRYLYGDIDYEWDQLATDFDATANDFSVVQDIGQYQVQETHELQVLSTWDKSWQYLFGIYYFEDENDQPIAVRPQAFGSFTGNSNLDRVTVDFVNFWDNPEQLYYFQRGVVDNESWAVFGEVDVELSEQWALTLGLRYSDDTYKGGETQLQYYDTRREGGSFAFDASQSTFAGDPNRYTDTLDAFYEDDFQNTTGKITLSYRPMQGHLLWGTLSNGYKMGGVRLGSLERFYSEAAGVPSDGVYDQEDLMALELGWKGSLCDSRLQTELVAFAYDYSDMQRERSRKGPPPGGITLTEVVNVDTEMYGVEFSGTYLVTDELRAILSSSYNHSEITSDTFFENFTFSERDDDGNLIPINVNGNELTITPQWKASLSLHYTTLTDWGTVSLGGTSSFVDKRYFNLINTNSEDAYTRLDLQAFWQSVDSKWKVLLTVENATDSEIYNTYGCSAPNDGEFGTESFVVRCSGTLMDPRLVA
ncbi:MAG: TonB-dependent receptor, partial [Halioglobus sp.]|nr:TonB-dependent receptor [Halioglobus sp.]